MRSKFEVCVVNYTIDASENASERSKEGNLSTALGPNARKSIIIYLIFTMWGCIGVFSAFESNSCWPTGQSKHAVVAFPLSISKVSIKTSSVLLS